MKKIICFIAFLLVISCEEQVIINESSIDPGESANVVLAYEVDNDILVFRTGE